MDELIVGLVTAAMRSASINAEQLAERTAIPRVTLRRRMKEGVSFTINELDRVAGVLGVDILDLIPTRDRRSKRKKAS